MKIRRRVTRVVAFAVVVSMPLMGLSGVASAAKRGSAPWCANHPRAATTVLSCSAAAGGGTAGGSGTGAPAMTVQIDPNPVVETGAGVIATIQVETNPSLAGDQVDISSFQFASSCQVFEGFGTNYLVLNGGVDSIPVPLDDDGNATVLIAGVGCAPGPSLVAADLVEAPYLTATTTLTVARPLSPPPA